MDRRTVLKDSRSSELYPLIDQLQKYRKHEKPEKLANKVDLEGILNSIESRYEGKEESDWLLVRRVITERLILPLVLIRSLRSTSCSKTYVYEMVMKTL